MHIGVSLVNSALNLFAKADSFLNIQTFLKLTGYAYFSNKTLTQQIKHLYLYKTVNCTIISLKNWQRLKHKVI